MGAFMYNKYDISEFIFEEFQGGREFMNYLYTMKDTDYKCARILYDITLWVDQLKDMG